MGDCRGRVGFLQGVVWVCEAVGGRSKTCWLSSGVVFARGGLGELGR